MNLVSSIRFRKRLVYRYGTQRPRKVVKTIVLNYKSLKFGLCFVYILCHTPSRLWIVDIVSHVDRVIRSQRHRNSRTVDAGALYAVQVIENYF